MTRQRAAARPIPLTGVPFGLNAYPIEEVRPEESGNGPVVRTRRGNVKLALVELRAAEPDIPDAPLDPALERFVLGAARRSWSTVEGALGPDAWDRAVELARARVITIRCRVEGAARIGTPIAWYLTTPWTRRRIDRHAARQRRTNEGAARRDVAAAAVESRCPPLARALRAARPGTAALSVLVMAAEDLVEGVSHAGPRAFSQVHFGDTKAHEHVVDVLRAAGVPDEVVATLGLRRSARIGVAGPVRAFADDDEIPIDALDGPVLLRADQSGLRLSWRESAPLVVVENLQAAEAVADRYREVGVLYSAGMLGPAALALVSELAVGALGLVIACDADPGGVRIATQVLDVAPDAQLVDAGEFPHPNRERWPSGGVAIAALQSALDGPARSLAAGCLRRGYPVEQEAAIIDAAAAALKNLRQTRARDG